MDHIKVGSLITRDGIRLHFIEAGSGKPLVFIPGWSQTAAMFRHQIEGLSRSYRVIAIDMRGHGEAEKPAYGYRIPRLAADLSDALRALELKDVALAGHSMGCSVIWSYLDQFGAERLSKLILIDQAATLTSWKSWTEQEKLDCGSIFTAKSLFNMADRLAGPRGDRATSLFIAKNFFTKAFPRELVRWVITENLKFPRLYAARLLLDHGAQDWRDTIARITLPTLIFGGEASIFKTQSQKWMARQIPNAEVKIFKKDEGGSHFMWLENPNKFNQRIQTFLG
jgi:non-heme chloroperoxidase